MKLWLPPSLWRCEGVRQLWHARLVSLSDSSDVVHIMYTLSVLWKKKLQLKNKEIKEKLKKKFYSSITL